MKGERLLGRASDRAERLCEADAAKRGIAAHFGEGTVAIEVADAIELAFFHGYYGTYCYLPLFVFARVRGEGEQYLVSAELRPSKPKDVDGILIAHEKEIDAVEISAPALIPGLGDRLRLGSAAWAMPAAGS